MNTLNTFNIFIYMFHIIVGITFILGVLLLIPWLIRNTLYEV